MSGKRMRGKRNISAYVVVAAWDDVTVAEDDEPPSKGDIGRHCVRALCGRR